MNAALPAVPPLTDCLQCLEFRLWERLQRRQMANRLIDAHGSVQCEKGNNLPQMGLARQQRAPSLRQSRNRAFRMSTISSTLTLPPLRFHLPPTEVVLRVQV